VLRGHSRIVGEDEVVTIDGNRHLVLGAVLGGEGIIGPLTDLTRRNQVPVPDGVLLAGLTIPRIDDPGPAAIRPLSPGPLHGVVLAGIDRVILGDMLGDVVQETHHDKLGLRSEELERILGRSNLLTDGTTTLMAGPLSNLVIVRLGDAVIAEPTEVLVLLGDL